MKPISFILVALLVVLSACTFTKKPSSTSSLSPQEQISKAILEDKFAELELEYSAFFEKYRAEKKDTLDPFGGAHVVDDDRLTLIYEPYCVRILGKDPSRSFLEILDRRQHPIRPGSSFKPHPRKFASPKERVDFDFSNPPGLFSISEIEVREDGTVVVELSIYRNESNAEGWKYILRRVDRRWTVLSKKTTYIS